MFYFKMTCIIWGRICELMVLMWRMWYSLIVCTFFVSLYSLVPVHVVLEQEDVHCVKVQHYNNCLKMYVQTVDRWFWWSSKTKIKNYIIFPWRRRSTMLIIVEDCLSIISVKVHNTLCMLFNVLNTFSYRWLSTLD